MNRNIITQRDVQRARPQTGSGRVGGLSVSPQQNVDDYKTRLLKYIPAEVVTLYVTLEGVIGEQRLALLWLVFLIGLIATPFYLVRIYKVSKRSQLIISTVAFAVWVLALGGPFESIPGYEPLFGSIILVLYTFLVPLFDPDTTTPLNP